MPFVPSDRKSQASLDENSVEHSLIIAVVRKEENVSPLLAALEDLARDVPALEVVFVVDGSPDRSAEALAKGLTRAGYAWQLIELSRNFGSFAAIRQGLVLASGQ